MESLVKGAYLRGHALPAGTDDSLYPSVGRVYLLYPVSFPSQDQMITEMLLRSVFALHCHQHIRHHEGIQRAIEVERRHSILNPRC